MPPHPSPFSLWFAAAGIAVEAQAVIALRLVGMATGTTSTEEAVRMHTEKVAAFVEAQNAMLAVTLAGHPERAAARATSVIRRRVRANRRRLTRRQRH